MNGYLTSLPAYAQQSNDLKTRFLREAPQKWEEYLGGAKKIQGKCKLTFTEVEPKPGSNTRVDEIKQNETSSLLMWGETVVLEGAANVGSAGQVWCTNSKYSFSLTREKVGKPWIADEIELDPKKALRRLGEPVRVWVNKTTCAHLYAGFFYPLPTVLKDKNFVIKRINPAGNEARPLVRLDYEYREKVGQCTSSYSGWMTLDPKNYWLIVTCENLREDHDYRGLSHFQYETTAARDGLPLLSRILLRHDGTGDKATKHTRNMVAQLDLRVDDSVAEKEFRLSAFGLPEPKGMEMTESSGPQTVTVHPKKVRKTRGKCIICS